MAEDTRVPPGDDSGGSARKDYEFSGLTRLGTLETVTQTGNGAPIPDGLTPSS